jgi:hypothetical protein
MRTRAIISILFAGCGQGLNVGALGPDAGIEIVGGNPALDARPTDPPAPDTAAERLPLDSPALQDAASVDGTSARAVLELSPRLVAFPLTSTSGACSPRQSLTVTNSGTIPSGSIVWELQGDAAGDFMLTTQCPPALAPGFACVAQIEFKPRATGTREVTVGLSADPGGSAQSRLAGVASAETYLAITPTPSIFVLGTATADQELTVTNLYSESVGPLSISLDGQSPFRLTADTCTTKFLEPCAIAISSCTVKVQYVGMQPTGAVSARLSATIPNATTTVTLVGSPM